MDIIRKALPYPKDFFFPSFLPDKEEILFFDIETTGLSPKSAQIYSIGLLLFKASEMEIVQLFANSLSEEIEVLQGFQEYCKGKTRLISFNGKAFDTPFLEKSYRQYGLKSPITGLPQLDLFKMIQSRRKFYQLPSYKLKECERFLGIQREDIYTGGELIYVYLEYLEHPTEEAKALLLQHNFEDLLYLPSLFSFFAYEELFQGKGSYCREKSELLLEKNKLRLCFRFGQMTLNSESEECPYSPEAKDSPTKAVAAKSTFFPKTISHSLESFHLEVSRRLFGKSPYFPGKQSIFSKTLKTMTIFPPKTWHCTEAFLSFILKKKSKGQRPLPPIKKRQGSFSPSFPITFPIFFKRNTRKSKTTFPLFRSF